MVALIIGRASEMGLKNYIEMTVGQLITVTITPILIALIIFGAVVIGLGVIIICDVVVPLFASDYPRMCKGLILLHVFTNSYMFLSILQSFLVDLTKAIIIQWIVIIVSEIIIDQLYVLKHSSDESPDLGTTKDEWELMAALRSTNNGYGSKQFYTATVSDPVVVSDPFWPHHISVMYAFEIRRHTMMWNEVHIWQVSLLSGVQKKLSANYNVAVIDVPFTRTFDPGVVGSFQSRDVLFMFQSGLQNHLFVYDLLHRKEAMVKRCDQIWIKKIVSITCQQRLFGADGVLRGWRIVLLNAYMDRQDDVYVPNLVKWVLDVGTKGDLAVVSRVRRSFGSFENQRKLRAVRTSDCLFGVHVAGNDDEDGPCLLYDQFQGVFVGCRTLQELKDLDDPFDTYSLKAGQIYDEDLCPMVINQREAIEAFEDGRFYRLRLQPPTIKYTAALAAFRSIPDLKSTMNAQQFRAETGIAGMDAHFE